MSSFVFDNEGNSYKILQNTATATSSFISCCFTSAFTYQEISFFTTFENFIQHFVTKKDFHHEFPFFNIFTQTSPLP